MRSSGRLIFRNRRSPICSNRTTSLRSLGQKPLRRAGPCAGSERNKRFPASDIDQKEKTMFITLRLMAFALLLVATVLFASAFRTSSLSAQNANSSTTTNKNQNQNDTRSITPPAAAKAPAQDFSKNT